MHDMCEIQNEKQQFNKDMLLFLLNVVCKLVIKTYICTGEILFVEPGFPPANVDEDVCFIVLFERVYFTNFHKHHAYLHWDLAK